MQVVLSFPTLGAAVRYAKQEGLSYVVRGDAGSDDTTADACERGLDLTEHRPASERHDQEV